MLLTLLQSGGAGPGVITGTLAATETGSDVAALVGDVLVSGSLAATEVGSDVAAIFGVLTITGTLAATEVGSDVAVILGPSGPGPTGPGIAFIELRSFTERRRI